MSSSISSKSIHFLRSLAMSTGNQAKKRHLEAHTKATNNTTSKKQFNPPTQVSSGYRNNTNTKRNLLNQLNDISRGKLFIMPRAVKTPSKNRKVNRI